MPSALTYKIIYTLISFVPYENLILLLLAVYFMIMLNQTMWDKTLGWRTKWKGNGRNPHICTTKNVAMTESLMLAVHLQKLYQLLHSCGKSNPPTTEPNSFLYARYSHSQKREAQVSWQYQVNLESLPYINTNFSIHSVSGFHI